MTTMALAVDHGGAATMARSDLSVVLNRAYWFRLGTAPHRARSASRDQERASNDSKFLISLPQNHSRHTFV